MANNNRTTGAVEPLSAASSPQYDFRLIFPPSKENIYQQSGISFSFKIIYTNRIEDDLRDKLFDIIITDESNLTDFYFLNLSILSILESADSKQEGLIVDRKLPSRIVFNESIDDKTIEFIWNIEPNLLKPGVYEAFIKHNINGSRTPENDKERFNVHPNTKDTIVKLEDPPTINRPFNVSLNETKRIETPDQLLWILIRNRTIKFDRYQNFIDTVMCRDPKDTDTFITPTNPQKYLYANRLPFNNVASYSLLKFATEKYLMQECGLVPTGLLDGSWPLFQEIFNNSDELGRTARAAIIDLEQLKKEYLEELFDSNGSLKGLSLPYLKVIKDKLSEIQLKEPYAVGINLVDGANTDDTINIDACYGILPTKLLSPCMLELIWSYWHEEGGLVQTMNAISLRFQNIRNNGGRDPLGNFNLDPLRPLNNLLWGYIEDERNRLSITRRNLEYQYEYGISLIGRAVPQVGVAEHRTNFIRAFHNLLKVALDFYNQANFTTVIPDAFPLLNHLREVHLLLAEGAHNQYGELPWTSRIEMLTQQWLLSRPEMREFLGTRIMVPYNEAWMDKVDNMKTLQGWNDTNITHFHDLGVFGEQLLLSVRYGSWNSTTDVGAQNAANWAHYWRNEVQRYVHAYNAVTGVDLSADVTDARVQISTAEDRYTPPAILIQKQVALQKSRQQYALQANATTPGLLQNRPTITMPPQSIPVLGQKKLNG